MTRRKSRAYVFFTPVPGSQIVHGIVQPRVCIPLPRRYPSRGVVRFITGPGYINGQSQSLSTRVPARRVPSRVFFRGVTGTAHQPAITWFTQISRRKSTRGQYHITNAPQPPSGVTQPPAILKLAPRRSTSRFIWRQVNAVLPGPPYIQPWPTVSVPRRYPFRAHLSLPYSSLFSGQDIPGTINGRVQSLATFPVARKDKRQRSWFTPTGHGPALVNGQVQPWSTRQPRRGSARLVFLRSAQGQPHYAYEQPRASVSIPRRYPARGQYHGNAVPPIAAPYIQPHVVFNIRPRTRATIRSVLGPNWFFGTGGKIQPLVTKLPRRNYARAIVAARHAPWLTSVSFAIEFDIIELEARDFEMAFNILPGTGARVGLLASVPMLSPSTSKMYPGGYLQSPTGDPE